jgi:3-hydroxyisobutyrate dehydrogenase
MPDKAVRSASRSARKAVGVIGLGNIGRGVAESLIRKKTWDVLVWDAAQSPRKHFENRRGVSVVPPGEIGARAFVIIFVVPGTTEILSCLRGKNGIFETARRGLTIYDFTTSDPARSRRVAKQAAAFGISYLDAGTSGGPYKADTGKLLAMVGGDEMAFKRTKPVLGSVCEHMFYVGPSGAGHTLKLLHNIVCHATTLATGEAGHIAERAGISLKDMIDVFNHSNARSYASEFRFPRHIVSKTWDARGSIYNQFKDIRMGVRLGRKLDVDTTFSRATLKVLSWALDYGMGEKDSSLLYRDFELYRQQKPRHRHAAKKRGATAKKRAQA